MKRMIRLLSIVALLTVVLSSCEKVVGEGPVVSQDRHYTGFEKVRINTSGKVVHSVGNEYKVRIHAQQNILDIITSRMDGNELIIKFKDGKSVRTHHNILIELVSPVLEVLRLEGSADAEIKDVLEQDRFDLKLEGSGDIVVEGVNLTNRLKIDIEGSGDITVRNGTTNYSRLKITGSGDIRTEAVLSKTALAEISGSGDILLNVTDALEAKINGSGSVLYRGNPQVTASISGSGRVRPL